MASKFTCLVVTLVGVLMMTGMTYSLLPESSAFVGMPSTQLRGLRTTMNVADPKKPKFVTEADKQYGKEPPTEAPIEVSNNIFLFFSVFSIGCLVAFIFFTSAGRFD